MDAGIVGVLIGISTMGFVVCVLSCYEQYKKRKKSQKLLKRDRSEKDLFKKKNSKNKQDNPLLIVRAPLNKKTSMKNLFSTIPDKNALEVIRLS